VQKLRHRLIPASVREQLYPLMFELLRSFRYHPPKSHYPIILSDEASGKTNTDAYWGTHTVKDAPFLSAKQSLDYLEWRFQAYPLFRDLMELYADHAGEVILDYGCGPGNDVVGFLQYSNTGKVIGIDVSRRSLELTAYRIAVHGFPLERVELRHISDSVAHIPLENASVDYVLSGGVIHHASEPASILRELYRVLKPGGTGCIMVYNYRSIFVHLYVAYARMILDNVYPGLSLEEVFQRSTDGEDCPVSRYYREEEFVTLCQQAGFEAEFKGGYIGESELNWWRQWGAQAKADQRLAEEHRNFLNELTFDSHGYPSYRGKYAGIGGVYCLHKTKESTT
jgi:ubiquinone/menaquinone biosynthesis C-methylase UbiE